MKNQLIKLKIIIGSTKDSQNDLNEFIEKIHYESTSQMHSIIEKPIVVGKQINHIFYVYYIP